MLPAEIAAQHSRAARRPWRRRGRRRQARRRKGDDAGGDGQSGAARRWAGGRAALSGPAAPARADCDRWRLSRAGGSSERSRRGEDQATDVDVGGESGAARWAVQRSPGRAGLLAGVVIVSRAGGRSPVRRSSQTVIEPRFDVYAKCTLVSRHFFTGQKRGHRPLPEAPPHNNQPNLGKEKEDLLYSSKNK